MSTSKLGLAYAVRLGFIKCRSSKANQTIETRLVVKHTVLVFISFKALDEYVSVPTRIIGGRVDQEILQRFQCLPRGSWFTDGGRLCHLDPVSTVSR